MRVPPDRKRVRRVSLLARSMNFLLPRLRALDAWLSRSAQAQGQARDQLNRLAEASQSSDPGQAAEWRTMASRAMPDRD